MSEAIGAGLFGATWAPKQNPASEGGACSCSSRKEVLYVPSECTRPRSGNPAASTANQAEDRSRSLVRFGRAGWHASPSYLTIPEISALKKYPLATRYYYRFFICVYASCLFSPSTIKRSSPLK